MMNKRILKQIGNYLVTCARLMHILIASLQDHNRYYPKL